jgi:hypothetical protein
LWITIGHFTWVSENATDVANGKQQRRDMEEDALIDTTLLHILVDMVSRLIWLNYGRVQMNSHVHQVQGRDCGGHERHWKPFPWIIPSLFLFLHDLLLHHSVLFVPPSY